MSSRKPAARVRRALPNLTTVDVGLGRPRERPNHMILTGTRVICLGRPPLASSALLPRARRTCHVASPVARRRSARVG